MNGRSIRGREFYHSYHLVIYDAIFWGSHDASASLLACNHASLSVPWLLTIVCMHGVVYVTHSEEYINWRMWIELEAFRWAFKNVGCGWRPWWVFKDCDMRICWSVCGSSCVKGGRHLMGNIFEKKLNVRQTNSANCDFKRDGPVVNGVVKPASALRVHLSSHF